MCGILGLIQKRDDKINLKSFEIALRLLSHRGPDGQGSFVKGNLAIGHRRLSIIDLEGG